MIQKEKILVNGRIEDREQLCRSVLEAAKAGKLEIVVSTFCLVEVCKEKDGSVADKIADFFENDYVLPVAVDWFVGVRARQLMQAGHGLKPADACHLATALVANNVNEMHTFDGKLLGLNGKLDKADGTKLKICKPGPLTSAPLFDQQHSS
ncbi:type II toxin-antitoxin system VapC family toxin [Bradyrhizobium elkanii]